MWIRVDDTVEIIAGADRGEKGKVLRVDRQAGKMVVEHVNLVRKHVRRSQRNPQGGRLSIEMPIPMSNAMLICQKCNVAARMGARFLDDGSKERFCKKCGAGNGQIAPPHKQHAKN